MTGNQIEILLELVELEIGKAIEFDPVTRTRTKEQVEFLEEENAKHLKELRAIVESLELSQNL